MAIDKSIDYVEQDGYKNYIKNSKSVTVPKEFKSRANATPTKLAYITKDEAKMLKKMKKGTPHKGPSGIPSYDDYDAATGSFRSGAAMSAAESGKNTSDTLAAGMSGKDVQDIRSSVIAAGAGQRVNPGFFDSKNVISPEELRLAREYANRPGNLFAKKAMRKTRGGGIMDFLTGGGFTGALVKGIGRRLGFGKRFDEPTYDMSQFNNLGLLTNRVNPNYYNDLGNEGLLSLVKTGATNTVPFDADTFDDNVNFMNTKPVGTTTFLDEFDSTTLPDDNVPLPPKFNLGLPIDQYVKSDVNPLFRNMVTRIGMNEPQKNKALREIEAGVDPEFIMPKLQQLDDKKYGLFKTKDRITSNDLIKFYEDRGIKLSDEQKMKIVKAAGEDI